MKYIFTKYQKFTCLVKFQIIPKIPYLLNFIDNRKDVLNVANAYLYTQKLLFLEKVYKEYLDKTYPEAVTTPIVPEPQPTEPGKDLTAFQKLLFVRLLQQVNLFPRKPANTDDAPELKAIALLTGLSYENNIKGRNGANSKVSQLLNQRERRSFSAEQTRYKLADLDAVETVARLLNCDPVIAALQEIRADLNE